MIQVDKRSSAVYLEKLLHEICSSFRLRKIVFWNRVTGEIVTLPKGNEWFFFPKGLSGSLAIELVGCVMRSLAKQYNYRFIVSQPDYIYRGESVDWYEEGTVEPFV